MAGEIVSPSSVENDYITMAAAYAAAKIPVYLVLDPCVRRATVFTRPADGAYRAREEFAYGERIRLPLSVGTVEVDTGGLPVAPPAAQREAWPRHRTA
ncbi:Uma2 family endonuclease [Streptomyces sp. JJ36]|uniref:Uma2 family endonuclease n=1 Tax=Streptomyces sp. JJ36 TaxID=2736645 RepID=UPI001F26DE6F|nr:Uma2 family endonuclease [Streptomyces sp. JJ36]MCF6525099.1 Uma2 family endonuclease [Streptomyces sp. JJ36]